MLTKLEKLTHETEHTKLEQHKNCINYLRKVKSKKKTRNSSSEQAKSNPRLGNNSMDKIIRIINYTDYINHEYVFGGKYINYKYTLLKRKSLCSETVFALSESMVIVYALLFLLLL